MEVSWTINECAPQGKGNSNYLSGSESFRLAYDGAIPMRTFLLPFPFFPLTPPHPCCQPERHLRQQLADRENGEKGSRSQWHSPSQPQPCYRQQGLAGDEGRSLTFEWGSDILILKWVFSTFSNHILKYLKVCKGIRKRSSEFSSRNKENNNNDKITK